MNDKLEISNVADLSNDKNVKFFCKGKEVKFEIDKSNPLKLVNGIDGMEIKIPTYRMNTK